MLYEGIGLRRLFLTVLVVFATLSAQAASLTAEPETHHVSDHCCGLCHLGPIPILPSTVTGVAAPHFAPVWLADSGAAGAPRQVLVTSAASRAPPV